MQGKREHNATSPKLGWFFCSSPPTLLLLPFKEGEDTEGKRSLCISGSYEIIMQCFPSSLLITRASSHKGLVRTKPFVNLQSHRREIAELEIMTFKFNSLPQISIKPHSLVSRALAYSTAPDRSSSLLKPSGSDQSGFGGEQGRGGAAHVGPRSKQCLLSCWNVLLRC